MKKQAYIKPAMQVVPISVQAQVLAGSPVKNVDGNSNLNLDDDGFDEKDDDV